VLVGFSLGLQWHFPLLGLQVFAQQVRGTWSVRSVVRLKYKPFSEPSGAAAGVTLLQEAVRDVSSM
jgi:hypothetical protein